MPEPLTVSLSDLPLAILDEYRLGSESGMTREDALVHAFTKWAIAEGLIDDPVEDNTVETERLNASNDI